MNVWILFLILGIITFAERLSFIVWADRLSMPVIVQRGLRYVPVTVLSALIAPGILRTNEMLELSLMNPKLIAGAAAIILIMRTGNVLLTIIVGMAVFYGAEWLTYR